MGTEPSAQTLFRAGRLSDARLSGIRALDDRPTDPRLLKLVGNLSLYENRPEDAVRYLKLALDQKRHWPLNLSINVQLGMAHYRLDGFPDAAEQFAGAAGPLPVGPLAGLAGIARQLAAFGDAVPYRIHGPDETRLEFVATDPLPAIELSVNAGPPALFLIDTGGAELVLDSSFATEAGAELAGALRGEYAGRRRARTGLGRVGSVQAGALRIDDVPIHTLDLGALPDFFGIGIRGILGTRFLMHFLATIDYPGGALILRRRPGRLAHSQDAHEVPFWLADTHLILVRGRLNDLPPTILWVDTGLAASGLLAAEKQLRAAGVTVDWSAAREGPGGGGSVKQAGVVIDKVTVGEADHAVTRHAVPGTVVKKPPSILGSRLGFEVGGLVSHAFFRPYAVTLDFTRMRLVLEPRSGG